jgi:hypothetical protein
MDTIDFAVEGAKASPRRPATKRQGDPLTTQEERCGSNDKQQQEQDQTQPSSTTTVTPISPETIEHQKIQAVDNEVLPGSAPVGL